MACFSLEDDDYGDMFMTQNCSQVGCASQDIIPSQESVSFEGNRFNTSPRQPQYENISNDEDFDLPSSPPMPSQR